MKTFGMTVLAAALSLGTAASAATFSISGGTAGINPGANNQASSPTNNVLTFMSDTPSSIGGFFGSEILVNSDQKVLIEVFGWEAAFRNQATVEGVTVGASLAGAHPGFNVATDTLNPVEAILHNITAGSLALEFNSFSPSGGGGFNNVATSTNGSNIDATVNPGTGNGDAANFFASFGPGKEGNVNGNSIWLFYDDDGVPGDNHDDLVIRISAVPLPAGMLLLISGLGALAVRRRMT